MFFSNNCKIATDHIACNYIEKNENSFFVTMATVFGNYSNHRLVQHTTMKSEKLQFFEVIIIAPKANILPFWKKKES